MTQRALVTDTLAESGLEILRRAGDVELDYRPGLKGADLLRAVSESDALITRSGTAVTKELVNAGTRLRIVGRAGVGLDNVDVDACTARGILVINAPTANIMSATEHTMAMLLAFCRNIPEAHASVKRGEWVRSKFMGLELNGKTLGIIGLGRIGTRVTARARAFGMRVIAYDPYSPEATHSLDDLLAEADVVSMHAIVTPETEGMIGAEQFARMKDGAVFVNTARAMMHDTDALVAALQSGHLGGAGLDHFIGEHIASDHPLCSMSNVVLTPHIGGATYDTEANHSRLIADDLCRLLEGERPQHICNPEVLESRRVQTGGA